MEIFLTVLHYSACTHGAVSSLGWEGCYFSSPEKQYTAQSREQRLCNHCPASALLSLCFLLVLELTVYQRRKGFEPEGSSLFQRLIATSEQGTAPKQTFTAVKTGLAPNDVGQQGFLQQVLYGDGCQRWTNSRTLAVSSSNRSQIRPRFNSCLLVERKRLIKVETLICCGPSVSQPKLTTKETVQRWTILHLIIALQSPRCKEDYYRHRQLYSGCHRTRFVNTINTSFRQTVM